MSAPMGEHSGGQIGQLAGGTSATGDHGWIPPLPAAGKEVGRSAAKVQQYLLSVLLMLAFVVVLTLVAGISPQAGKAAVAFMVLLLVLQGITHASPFGQWVQGHPLTPQA